MDTFYCIECRRSYPLEKLGRPLYGAHRDGERVGFCFLCARNERATDLPAVPEADDPDGDAPRATA